MKQQRIASLDLIRTVAILLVIMQHAWSGMQLDEPNVGAWSYGYHALVVMGVPLFFMLSGALLLDSQVTSIGHFLTKRFKRLLLPFFLWGTVVYIIAVAMHKYPDVATPMAALRAYIPYMLEGRVNASHWYIYVLIGLYLLTPFLQRALAMPQGKQLAGYGVALWVIWMLLRAFYPGFASMHYYSASGFMYLGFFLLGYYVVKFLGDNRLCRRVGCIGFLVAYPLNVWCLSTDANTTLIHAVAVVSLFLLIKSWAVPHRMTSFVTSSGRYTYVIYFVHVLVVSLFCTLDIWGWCPLWLQPIVITLPTYIISYGCAWLLDRLRFVPNAWVGI